MPVPRPQLLSVVDEPQPDPVASRLKWAAPRPRRCSTWVLKALWGVLLVVKTLPGIVGIIPASLSSVGALMSMYNPLEGAAAAAAET